MMKLKQLEAFVTVADYRSFSKAAKLLYLTQPTVSAHISGLEKELNSCLFARNTKEVHLTEQGGQLYIYARQMMNLQERIMELFTPDGRRQAQPLTVAASTVPAGYLLPDILGTFRKQYPQEELKIWETDSAKVVHAIEELRADVGFTGTILPCKSIRYVPVYEDELVVIMPNTDRYRRIAGQEQDLRWIADEPMIMREEGSGTRKEAEKYLQQAGLAPESLHVTAQIENTETIRRSVRSGLGITIISRLAVKEDMDAGAVLSFPLCPDGVTRNLYMVYQNGCSLSRPAQHLVRIVREWCMEHGTGCTMGKTRESNETAGQ